MSTNLQQAVAMEAAAFLLPLPLPLHLPAFLFGHSTLALAAFCAAYFQVSSNDCKMRCGREGYNVVSGERRAELWRVEATHFELFGGGEGVRHLRRGCN